jgi:hypothetical protein
MICFKNVADIKTADMLDLDVPGLKDNGYKIIATEPSLYIQDKIAEFADRAEAIRSGNVSPDEDNMLKITNEGRLLGVDPRLLDPNAPIEDDSKLDLLIQYTFEEYKKSNDILGTQIIFSDVGTPGSSKAFNVYDYVKEELIKKGIPDDEICFIHDAKNDKQKEVMFEHMRSGTKRIILGSTLKMGTGTNIQDRLVAEHHVDCPYRPSDIEQREGRIIRQGNMNKEVNVYRYVTKDSFDTYLWQMVERKQKFISQIMTSNDINRQCEDVDETVLSYAEVKALSTGNPLIKEKMDIDTEVSRLELLKRSFTNTKYKHQDAFLYKIPKLITSLEQNIEKLKNDIILRNNQSDSFKLNINGVDYYEREDAREAFKNALVGVTEKENIIGSFKGFELSVSQKNILSNVVMTIKGHGIDRIDLGQSASGNITRIENHLMKFDESLLKHENYLVECKANLKESQRAFEEPFEHEEKLSELKVRQGELNALLSADDVIDGQEEQIDNKNVNEYIEVVSYEEGIELD